MLSSPSLARVLRTQCFRESHRPHTRTFRRLLASNATFPWHRAPTIRDRVAANEPPPLASSLVVSPLSWRHLFAAGFSSICLFAFAAGQTNELTDQYLAKASDSTLQPSVALFQKRYEELSKRINDSIASVNDFTASSSFPHLFRGFSRSLYTWCAINWLNASPGVRFAYSAGLVNFGVWVLWRVPRLRPFMHRHFVHDPLSGRVYTLFTSLFSHKSFLHLAATTVTLPALGSLAGTWMWAEELRLSNYEVVSASTNWHFAAFFLSAGLWATALSHFLKARIVYPRLVRTLATPKPSSINTPTLRSRIRLFLRGPSAAAATSGVTSASDNRRRLLRSLGPSGALYALVTLVAYIYPQSNLSLVFFPDLSLNIVTVISALLLLDVIGLSRGWRKFDHLTHLCGASFGLLYGMYGMENWLRERRTAKISEELFQRQKSLVHRRGVISREWQDIRQDAERSKGMVADREDLEKLLQQCADRQDIRAFAHFAFNLLWNLFLPDQDRIDELEKEIEESEKAAHEGRERLKGLLSDAPVRESERQEDGVEKPQGGDTVGNKGSGRQ